MSLSQTGAWRVPVLVSFLASVLLLGPLPACSEPVQHPTTRLEILDPRTDTLLMSLPIEPGDSFELRYTHSVSKSPVVGLFSVTSDSRIQPVHTHYRAYGPGLPWATELYTRAEDGSMLVSHEGEAPREELRLWVSALTADTMMLGDRVVELGAGNDAPALRVLRIGE